MGTSTATGHSNRMNFIRDMKHQLDDFKNHVNNITSKQKLSLQCPQDKSTVFLKVPEVVDLYPDFKLDVFNVETADGYILEIHRVGLSKIGRGRFCSKYIGLPVILQHGLLCDSSNWVLNGGNNKSLAFALASQGYDVWLTNSRGNPYCRKHKKYKT